MGACGWDSSQVHQSLAGMAKECLNVFVAVMVIHVHAVYLLCVCVWEGGYLGSAGVSTCLCMISYSLA